MAGWIHKSARRKKSWGKVKGKSGPITHIVRSTGESTSLYRDHIKSGGYVHQSPYTGRVTIHHAKKVPPTQAGHGFNQSPLAEAVKARITERLQTHFWQSDRRNGFDHWTYVRIDHSKIRTVVCAFNGDKAVFIRHDTILLTLEFSVQYSSRLARKMAKQIERIAWMTKEHLPVAPVEHPP